MSRILSHDIRLEFDPLRDVQEVESGLAVDVTEMLQTGIVRDAGESLDNNGIDDPSNIIGLVRDPFAAIDAQRAIKKYGKKNKPATEAAVESATIVDAPKPSE